MIDIIKIVLMHLFLLAAQAFYMLLSNKAMLKSYKYLYLIAIPVVTAFPAIIHHFCSDIYSVYEYAVVFCMITAAIVDVMFSGFFNRDYMTDARFFEYLCSFLMICTAAAWMTGTAVIFSFIITVILAVAAFAGFSLHKFSLGGLLTAAAMSAFSVLCSWAFVNMVL